MNGLFLFPITYSLMKPFFQNILLALLLWAGSLAVPVAGQALNPRFTPQKGDHIILLGNTFADRMRHYGYFETLLQKNYPGLQLTLRNMGWSADEVGLQPRPLNFPGFGEKAFARPLVSKEVTFQGFTHEGEKIVMPVALNFDGLNQDLKEQKADIIFLCFGMNEAFKGPAGLPQFEKDLNVFIKNLEQNKFNGRTAPKLVLVSPIAHENLGTYFPDPSDHNKNLDLYTKAMQKTAREKGIHFIDLFTPSFARVKAKEKPVTINGIHLNDAGYRLAADWMGKSLGFRNVSDFNSENSKKLLQVVKMKDDHFFYRWRAVNGEYIYGRRREPFGVIAFPPELRKLNQMTVSLDSVIWELGAGKGTESFKKAQEIVDRRGKPVDPMLLLDVPMTGRQGEAAKAAAAAAAAAAGEHAHHQQQEKVWPATTEKFKLPAGYEINLFASEKDFPIEKPVAMNFDARGRLWVATMPTYPQYYPGIPVHDRIVILEDTDGDGKADKHTVFADDLYLPLGFEFGDGGVYVSQEPDIVFLKDTDGDDKADIREVILTGFGSEDSHHATHAFTFGQDGAMYFNEGTFLNSQVETPYGPIHSYAGATYRFEPRSSRRFNPRGSSGRSRARCSAWRPRSWSGTAVEYRRGWRTSSSCRAWAQDRQRRARPRARRSGSSGGSPCTARGEPIGIARSDDPEVVEQQLCRAMPEEKSTRTSDVLILHGRRVCKPRPLCPICSVRDECDFFVSGKAARVMAPVKGSIAKTPAKRGR